MKKVLIGLVIVGVLIAIGGCGATAESRPKRDSTIDKDRKLQSEIESLVQQLGDDDWQMRESAQKELTELGEKLIKQYCQTKLTTEVQGIQRKLVKEQITKLAETLRKSCQDKDPEIRLRADLIRQHFYAWTMPKIVFVSDREGNKKIYVMDADGKNQHRLTENTKYASWPTWSPDGTKIAFVSSQDGNEEIYVLDANGENQKRLTKHKASDYQPA